MYSRILDESVNLILIRASKIVGEIRCRDSSSIFDLSSSGKNVFREIELEFMELEVPWKSYRYTRRIGNIVEI